MAPQPGRASVTSVDLLADVLRALRLQGTAYFRADFRAPWGMQMPGGPVASFHAVVDGRCHAAWDDSRAPRRATATLHSGDIIVFPHGRPHQLSGKAESPVVPAPDLLATRRQTGSGRTEFGGDGLACEIICGHFELDRSGSHPLLAALPPVVVLRRGEGTDPEWVATATRLAVMESTSSRPGSAAIVDRLAEALMIQLIRAHAERNELSTGFLAAIGDRMLGAALTLMHQQPAAPWSVEILARRIGASRSSFAARFKEVLGTSPMQYLTQWRMHGARELLGTQDLSLAEVATRVGYQSEFSFAKAYKRVFGQGPGAARRNAS